MANGKSKKELYKKTNSDPYAKLVNMLTDSYILVGS